MKTTWSKVWEALEPVYEWALESSVEEMMEGYSDGSSPRTTNIRLDAEVPSYDGPREALMDAFVYYFQNDLMELITNGDVDNYNNPFLKAFNGEVVRGQALSEINISKAKVYREYRPTRSTYEYTLYLVIFVDYGVDSAG